MRSTNICLNLQKHEIYEQGDKMVIFLVYKCKIHSSTYMMFWSENGFFVRQFMAIFLLEMMIYQWISQVLMVLTCESQELT